MHLNRLARAYLEHQRLLLGAVLWAAVLANQITSLVAHVWRAADPSCFNDDARQQIFPFFRYADSNLFQNDYISDYYLANLPLGYRTLYTVAGWSGQAELLSKALPYVLLGSALLALGIAAYRLSGPIAAATAAAIVLGSSTYLERIGGGLPRAFGYPMIALSMAALATGNAALLAVATCLAVCFYPVAGVVAGVTLAIWLLVLPSRSRGQARDWSLRRRLVLLATTLGTCISILGPTAMGSSRFGRVITPDLLEQFPEIGPRGRYIANDRAPFPPWSEALLEAADHSLFGAGAPWSRPIQQWTMPSDPDAIALRKNTITESVVLVSLVAWSFSARRRPEVVRLLVLPLAALLGYVVSSRVAPYLYLPQRYLIYTIPLVVALMVSSSLHMIFAMLNRPRLRQLLTAAASLGLLLVVGGSGSRTAGIGTHMARTNPVLTAVAALPPTALVAAWPAGIADFIPYLAKRRIFVAAEVHQAFHTGYTLEMRRRVSALIDAFSADSPEPIVRLYREFGVTHLIVADEFVGGKAPRYFRPFDGLIAAANVRLGGRTPATQRYLDRALVFRNKDVAILSLKDISEDP